MAAAQRANYRVRSKLEVFYTGGAAQLSRDAQFLACACGDEVKIVQVATGAVLQTFPGDSEPITALALSPDGRLLFGASRSLQLRCWPLDAAAAAAGSSGGDASSAPPAPPQALRSYRGHKAPIADMAVDASGGLLATSSADRSVRVWDVDGGFCTHAFTGHSGVVLRVLFHPRQLTVISAGDEGEVRVWDLVTKACTLVLKGHFSAVTALSLSADGWTLLSGGRDSVVCVWNLRDGAKRHTVPVYEALEALAWLPPGAPLPGLPPLPPPAAAGAAGGGKKAAAAAGAKPAAAAAAAPVCFAAGGERGVVRLWRADTARCVHEQTPAAAAATEAGGILELQLLPGAGGLMAATQDCRILFHHPQHARQAQHAEQQAQQQQQAGRHKSKKARLDQQAPSAPSTPAATQGGSSGAAAPGALVVSRQLVGNNDEVTDLRFITAPMVGEAAATAATGAAAGGAADAEPSSGGDGAAEAPKSSGGAAAAAAAAAAAPPTHLAVATNSEVVRIFDARTMSCTATLAGHSAVVLCLDALRLPSGLTLLASGSKDATLRLWNALEGRCLGVGSGHVSAVSAVAFARKGGGFLASAGADKLLKVWSVGSVALDAETPQKLKVTAAVAAHDKDINTIAVAPNDSVLATGSQDRTIKLWRLPNLVPTLTLRGHKRGVWALAFSPVDQALASASGDQTLRLWSLADGSCLRTFEGHLASVLRLDFLSAGTQLLSAGADGLLKLWSVRSTECCATFEAHEDKVWALAAGAGGALLATGGGDGAVAVWEDCTQADQQEAAAASEAAVLQEQQLHNALQDSDFERAARLAFDMRHPGRLLGVLVRAGERSPAQREALLAALAGGMGPEEIRTALEYCRDWNANSRHCAAAQALLGAVFRAHPPQELMKVPGLSTLLEALLAYSQRHFSRSDRLLRSTFLCDYILGAMHVLTPDAEAQQAQQAAGLPLLAAPEQQGAAAAAVEAANGHAPAAAARTANGHSSKGGAAAEGDTDGEGQSEEEPQQQQQQQEEEKGGEQQQQPQQEEEEGEQQQQEQEEEAPTALAAAVKKQRRKQRQQPGTLAQQQEQQQEQEQQGAAGGSAAKKKGAKPKAAGGSAKKAAAAAAAAGSKEAPASGGRPKRRRQPTTS